MNLDRKLYFNSSSLATLSLLIILVLRLLTLGSPGMVDPSESRFAVAAQQMLLSGDWVMPQIYSETGEWIAFASKPPLQYWLIAASFKVFGMNDWAARFPSYMALLISIGFILVFCRRFFSPGSGILASLVFVSSAGIYYFSAACLSDTTLTAAVTMAIVSLAFTFDAKSENETRLWGCLFFVGLALGVLAKGPVMLILSIGPIALWLLGGRRFSALTKLPWILGITIFLVVTTPWFILAEQASPGFLRYFLVYENFLRYFTNHFSLRYGTLHTQPYGMAWLMLLAVFVPWSFFLLKGLFAALFSSTFRTKLVAWWPSMRSVENQWLHLVIFWALWPILFFSFMRQLHPTYVFPAIPAFAILMARFLEFTPCASGRSKIWVERLINSGFLLALALAIVALTRGSSFSYFTIAVLVLSVGVLWWARTATTVAFCGAFCVLLSSVIIAFGDDVTGKRSTKFVFENLRKSQPPGTAIAFVQNIPLSAQFYSRAITSFPFSVAQPMNLDEFLSSKIAIGLIRTKDLLRSPSKLREQVKTKGAVGSWTMITLR